MNRKKKNPPQKLPGLAAVYEALSKVPVGGKIQLQFGRPLNPGDFLAINNVMSYYYDRKMKFAAASEDERTCVYTFMRET